MWFFKRKPRGTPVYIELNARMMPFERGEVFEDPIDAELKRRRLGSVTGGGTKLNPEHTEPVKCTVDMELLDLEKGIPFVRAALESLGAPKGSRLSYSIDGRDVELFFGVNEGLAIYLNGTDLPAEVYKNEDVNVLIDRLGSALEDHGVMLGHCEGRAETVLYFYGKSFARMEELVRPVMEASPLCQRARVVRVA